MARTSYTYQPPKSVSSFWLDQSEFETPQLAGSSVDVIKLSAYKRAISNFVRIVTGRTDIPVLYSSGRSSYTDGNQVVISANLEDENFDPTVGLALHEGSHVLLSDFSILKTLMDPSTSNVIDLLLQFEKSLGIESRPVAQIAESIKDIINVIEDRRIDRFVYDAAPGYRGYYQSMYDNYFNSDKITQVLMLNLKNKPTWDNYMFHIINFTNSRRKLDALPGLNIIWDLIDIPNINRLENTNDSIAVAIEVYKIITANVQYATPNQQSLPKAGGTGESFVPTNSAEPGADDAETVSDPNLDGGVPSMEDAADGDASDSDNDIPDDMPDDDTPDQTESIVDEQLTPKEKKLLEHADKAFQKQKNLLSGNIKKRKLTNADTTRVEAAASAGMDYEVLTINGKRINCAVAYGTSNEMYKSGLLGSHFVNPIKARARIVNSKSDYIQQGIVLGTILGKRLKTRDEERSLKTTRLVSGKIDRRLISELGFGSDRVFATTLHNAVKPAMIHISLDASGSMAGDEWRSAMKTAVAIAKAASMIQSLDCVISIRGTMHEPASPLMWTVYDSRKESFAAIKDKLYGVQASGSTPEGLCFEAIMKQLITDAAGKDAYFINICDGAPTYEQRHLKFSYTGKMALDHTRKQVERLRKENIKVLSYFVGNYGYSEFLYMYGKDARNINLENLNSLAVTLNELFERK